MVRQKESSHVHKAIWLDSKSPSLPLEDAKLYQRLFGVKRLSTQISSALGQYLMIVVRQVWGQMVSQSLTNIFFPAIRDRVCAAGNQNL